MTEQEAFDLYQTCYDVTDHWEDHWKHCPACGAVADKDGHMVHVGIEDVN
jgi:hypothetical protein